MAGKRSQRLTLILLGSSIVLSLAALASLIKNPESTGRWRMPIEIVALLLVIVCAVILRRGRGDGEA